MIDWLLVIKVLAIWAIVGPFLVARLHRNGLDIIARIDIRYNETLRLIIAGPAVWAVAAYRITKEE